MLSLGRKELKIQNILVFNTFQFTLESLSVLKS